jgi:hypothetical protein
LLRICSNVQLDRHPDYAGSIRGRYLKTQFELLNIELNFARSQMARFANTHLKVPPTFQPNDMVWLDRRVQNQGQRITWRCPLGFVNK